MRPWSYLRAGLFVLAAILSLGGPIVWAQTNTAPAAAQHPDEAAFLSANAAAMDQMMADMAVTPTGDVDADFVLMMIPHHQGAIDMALAVLRYGKNEQIRRIAQEIIVTQQQEIVAMRLALGQPLPPPAPAPTRVSPDPDSAPPVSAAPAHDHSSISHGSRPVSPAMHMNQKQEAHR